MFKNRAIITILNSIGSTSMPFNEFVLYRANHFNDEYHCIIVLASIEEDFIGRYKASLEKLEVNIIGCHGSYFKLSRILAKQLRAYGKQDIKPIIRLHHPRTGLAVQVLNLLFLRDIPVIYTVHSLFRSYQWRQKLLPVATFLLSNTVNFVSYAAENSFPRILRRLKANRISTIPNGVDLERVDYTLACCNGEPTALDDSKSPHLKLINIGRLTQPKNQIWLIRLLAKLPKNVKLTIVGGGELRAKMETLTQELAVSDRLRFTGSIPREKVYKELLCADLFVSSSIREGMPIGVLEAMALKCPVFLSDIAPHREIAQWDSSVKIIPLDSDSWVRSIHSFISMGFGKRSKIGQKNRKLVEAHFSLQQMHEKYTELYKQVLE